MKKVKFFTLTLLLFSLFIQAHAQYRVQLGAYSERVSEGYFTALGISNARLNIDHNDIHRYYLGDYSNRTEAEQALSDARQKGVSYPQIIDLQALKAACTCGYTPAAPVTSEIEHLECIFFDFDKSDITSESKTKLDNLLSYINTHPSAKVHLLAHTDSKGSNTYNEALSDRRNKAAKAYLIANGLAANHIASMRQLGEDSPIAVNEVNGTDSPEGRKYNRRVVFIVTNSETFNLDLEKNIYIEDHLRARR